MIFRPITLQEANGVLSFVQLHFAKMHELIAEGQRISELLSLSPKKRAQLSLDGSLGESVPKADLHARVLKKRLKEIEKQVRDELVALQFLGANVKSVVPARVIFLTERFNQPAYLSWQLGDNKIKNWHWPEENFYARRAIDDESAFGSLTVH